MLSNGDGSVVHEAGYRHVVEFPISHKESHANNVGVGEISKWAREAVELMGSGEFDRALYYMNLCLDDRDKMFPERILRDRPLDSAGEKYKLSESDELILLEKRCLVHMRLKMYENVLQGAALIISKRPNHGRAFKYILTALCKTNKFGNVADALSLWKKCAPNDIEMIEARTTMESCSDAVKNGVEPSDVYSNIEETLGLGVDRKTEPKIYEPQWKYRPVPSGNTAFVLCLQYRFGHCSLGEKCPDAHGGEELEEWKVRYSILNLTTMLGSQLDREAAYVKSILDKLDSVHDQREVIADEIPGVILSCSEPSRKQFHSTTVRCHTWNFAIRSTRLLKSVCLLFDHHRPYFKIHSAVCLGNSSSLNLITGEAASNSSLQLLEISLSPAAPHATSSSSGVHSYSIEVACTPDVFGTFRQTVVFDFELDGVPKLKKDISIEVVPPTEEVCRDEPPAPPIQASIVPGKKDSPFASNLQTKGTWNFGNADIVDSVTGKRVDSAKIGFALMSSAGVKNPGVSGNDKQSPYVLTKETYRDQMRSFLTEEERCRQVILSKYNISAHLAISDNIVVTAGASEGTRYSIDGNLFARMTLFRDICEDTPVGRLILRNCNSVLLAKTLNLCQTDVPDPKPRVYLCPIVEKTKNSMFFEIGNACVKELNLSVSEVSSFDIQFQLDRTTFLEQKKVIDQLTDLHLDMLFPDFVKDFQIPWNPFLQWNSSVESKFVRLNPKQKEAFNAVTVKTTRTPPILIIGPFGTGKTFTLFQCIKKLLLSDDDCRIMICTHSNSAADLYIKEYLHPMVKEGCEKARPLRIYYSLRSKLTVQNEIRPYCLYDDMDRFRCPTKEEILKHRVIVVTLSTSFMLIDLELPPDTFTHILLDEAAQAMESEAITPLLAAGENTKIVLAGDHMQLSPELFSGDGNHFHLSLLERLHCLYPDSHPCKLMLCENYRSHSSIIKFASDSFYQRKLECGMNQPVHEKYYPLTFFAARGEDVQDPDSTSYYNMAEVFEVTERVSDLIDTWPEKWGNWKKDNQIGVLTPYPDQVNRIRQRLRTKGLYSVSVERVLNVQGKQFRAVFLSTVRTHKPWLRVLPETVSGEVDLGFFSNPKLLNTALTRAQSLVAVVGDPVSLCALGKCRRLWEDFIGICEENGSLHGMTLSQIKLNIRGVEMRLKWGLNPMAKEFEVNDSQPVTMEPLTLSTTSISNTTMKPVPPESPSIHLGSRSDKNEVSQTSESAVTAFSSVSNPWQNIKTSQNFSANIAQCPVSSEMTGTGPMMPMAGNQGPVPTFMSGPRPFPSPSSQAYPIQVMPRASIGYPPMGQGYIAVPIHSRPPSAFAQYRAPHQPPRLAVAVPNFPIAPTRLGYPTMLPRHTIMPLPMASITDGNVQPHMIRHFDNNPWGQQYVHGHNFPGPPQSYMPMAMSSDQRQGNFVPLSHPSKFYVPQPPMQQSSFTQDPRFATWMPNPRPMTHSASSGPAQNEKLLPEEILLLQRILDEQKKSSTAPDAAIESIKGKLAHAVSGGNGEYPFGHSVVNHHSANLNKDQPSGLNLNNQIAAVALNTLGGSSLSRPNNSVGASLNTAFNPHGGDGLAQAQIPNGLSYNTMATNKYASFPLPYPPGYNYGAMEASDLGMNAANGHGYKSLVRPVSTVNANGDQAQRNNPLFFKIEGPTNAELSMEWLKTNSDSVPTNNHNYYTNANTGSTGNYSSTSATGRSYANAVKQPLTQTNSCSPLLTTEGAEPDPQQLKQLKTTSSVQPKPLMEMNVDFFPPIHSSSPQRTRGSSTPPPRFRTANTAKKSKKKK